MKNTCPSVVRQAFYKSLPVLAGYVILGIGFGILLRGAGYGALWALAMSGLIYAGSMQYVGVGLLAGGASVMTVILTTVMVNARHLFYGLAMLDKYRSVPGRKRWYLIFGMCDESFSINVAADVPEGVDRGWFYFFVTLLNQCYWVCGATLGGLFGSLLTFSPEGLEFVMTALLAVLFLEQLLKEKDHTSALLGVGLSAVCLILFGSEGFVIPSMLAILGALTLLRRPLERREAGEPS